MPVPKKYEHIDFKPPKSVAEAAAKGLELRQKASPSNRGGLTPAEASKHGIGSGVQRAVNLKNRDMVSPKVIKQMKGFLSRSEKSKKINPENKDTPWNDKGYVAWLLWGGDPAKAWVEKITKQMEAADEKEKKASISLRWGRFLFGSEAIPGGKARDKNPSDFNPKELAKGVKVEARGMRADSMTRPSAPRVALRFASGRTKRAGQTWYHLTDKANFKLNPKHTPEDNSVSIEDRSGQLGIYLGSDVEKWVNGYGYWRPFVVEFDVDPTVKEDPGVHGRWGGELFVPATSFDKISIKRVIPIDAWARENYGDFGWVEAFHLRRFDTGEPIETAGWGRLLNPPKGYRYPGPDVRQMPAGDVKRLKKDLRDFRKGRRAPARKTAAPFVDLVGGGYTESEARAKAQEIAVDHLVEIPDYYTRLDAMESEAGVRHSSLSAKWGHTLIVAGENEPTNPKLWEKVQSLTKGEVESITVNGKTVNGPNDGKGFTIFPSAYANGWASKVYGDLGGGWKKKAEAIGQCPLGTKHHGPWTEADRAFLNSRPKRAGKIPLNKETVEQFRKDFLMLAKNTDRIGRDPILLGQWRSAIRKWHDRFENFGAQIRDDLKGRIRENKGKPDWERSADIGWAQYYLDKMDPYWNFSYTFRDLPSLDNWQKKIETRDQYVTRTMATPAAKREGWTEESQGEWYDRALEEGWLPSPEGEKRKAWDKWESEAKSWSGRSKRRARAAWKYLNDLVEWTERGGLYGGGEENVVLTEPTVENTTLEGFKTQFVGFPEASEFIQKYLDSLKAGLRFFRQRANRTLPVMVQRMLPLKVIWAGDERASQGDAAASYHGSYIEMTIWGFSNDPKSITHILAHEMGHHIFKQFSGQQQKDWKDFIRGDYDDLDLREVMSRMRPNEDTGDFARRIKEEDPILHIQLESLYHHPSSRHWELYSVIDIQEYLDEGGRPVVKVPANPITGYANKNPEEAFCEALGKLVTWGPRTLPGAIVEWLKRMLPNLKVGSLYPSIDREARGKAKKDVGHGGLDEWFSGHGGAKGDATWGDWVSISPVTKTLPSGKKVEKGDIVGECGISDYPDWKEITKGGEDPLKCMPRQKAHDMPKAERAEKAQAKQRAEKADSSRGKKPTNTPTFQKEKGKTACIIAAGQWDGHKCLFKNRDRNYTPKVKVYHVLKDGVEILYMKDEITGWCEGLNSSGIGIVNSALAVAKDEKEKRLTEEDAEGATLRDGKRILEALSKTSVDDAVESIKTFDKGLKGHTFVADTDRTVSLEATWEGHDYHVRQLANDKKHVRTNHGQYHQDAGYTEEDGDDYLSSLARRDQAMKVIREVEGPKDIAPAIYGKRRKDRSDPLNMVKLTDGMKSTSQIVLDLSDLVAYLYLLPDQIEFQGYESDLPEDYEPKISLEIYDYDPLGDDGEFEAKQKTEQADSSRGNKPTMTPTFSKNSRSIIVEKFKTAKELKSIWVVLDPQSGETIEDFVYEVDNWQTLQDILVGRRDWGRMNPALHDSEGSATKDGESRMKRRVLGQNNATGSMERVQRKREASASLLAEWGKVLIGD